MLDEQSSKNDKYIGEQTDLILWRICRNLQSISTMLNGTINANLSYIVLGDLCGGILPIDQLKLIKVWEDVINKVFTSLYTDIKQVFYETQSTGTELHYKLIFRKMIDSELIDIPANNESTGTIKILMLLPLLLGAASGGVVFIDEIDSNIHNLLIKQIIDELEESITGQIIVTTHNTLLMESLHPSNIYVIDIDEYGHREINCIARYKSRIQKKYNIRLKYLRGDYSGIPYVGYVDFTSVGEELGAYCSDLLRGGQADEKTEA